MKINIQSIENKRLEVQGQVETTFLDEEMRRFYPEALKLSAVVDKFGRDYRIDLYVKTKAHYVCDRCLSSFEQNYEESQRQIYQVGEGTLREVEDEVIQLPANTTEIDLTSFISEIIYLYHPIKMVCKADCKGICPQCGANLNEEGCNCDSEAIDPRWEALRKLIK